MRIKHLIYFFGWVILWFLIIKIEESSLCALIWIWCHRWLLRCGWRSSEQIAKSHIVLICWLLLLLLWCWVCKKIDASIWRSSHFWWRCKLFQATTKPFLWLICCTIFAADSFDWNSQFLTFFEWEVLCRIYLCFGSIKAFILPVIFSKGFQSAFEIKWIISFRKLDANVSFLACLFVQKQNGKKSAAISAWLNKLFKIVVWNHALRKMRAVSVDKLDLALRRSFHHNSAFTSPHLFATPVFSPMSSRAWNRWNLKHIHRSFIHKCHIYHRLISTCSHIH